MLNLNRAQQACNKPADSGCSFAVLNYHRVMPIHTFWNEQVLDVGVFEQQLLQLKRFFRVLSLEQALQLASQGKVPANAVVITIDDGFADCYDHIFPLLQRYQLPATFFISTQGLQQGYLWENQIANAILQAPAEISTLQLQNLTFATADKTERHRSIVAITDLIKYHPMAQRNQLIADLIAQTGVPQMHHEFVTAEQLKQMAAAGMTIGAHTVHHPILALESAETARAEITQSKAILEQILAQPVHYFAYPNGKFAIDFSDEHVAQVRDSGFAAAFCTDWGQARPTQECRFRLRRFTPWDRNPWFFSLRLALHIVAERYSIRFLKEWVGTHGN
ncbi:polysaccharide deacetylase family protein [Rheinheimera sp.]|uniref:polysaccharide deacetylase family protein n=1 Tax=Rheinheimera sp. TaxID=1869214 RepID=UPI003D281F14